MKKMSLNYVNMNVWIVIIIVLIILFVLTGAGIGLYFIFRKSPDDKSSDKSSDGGNDNHGNQNGGRFLPTIPMKYAINSPYKISPPSYKNIGGNTFAISSSTGVGLWTPITQGGNIITMRDPTKESRDCKQWLFTYGNITNDSGKTLQNVLLWHGDGKKILNISTSYFNGMLYLTEPDFNVQDTETYSFYYDPNKKWMWPYTGGILATFTDPTNITSVRVADIPPQTTLPYQWNIIDPRNVQCS